MTRINLISPEDLYDQHLLAEHRELKRIPNLIKSGKFNLDNIPKNYVIWTGHIKFFYNKLKFLHNRYRLIYSECEKRGFKITNYENSFLNLPDGLYNDYSPTEEAIELNKSRLKEKIQKKSHFYKYYWKRVSKK